MVTDYEEHSWNFLHVREINFKPWTLVILNQIMQIDRD